MKSATTIQIEYKQVISQAEALAHCADDIEAARRELASLMEDLRSGWAGESADAYFQKCSEFSNKLKTSEKNLDQVSGVIKRTAKIYRDAELAAIKLAQD